MDNGKASETVPTVGRRESFRTIGLRSITQSRQTRELLGTEPKLAN